MIVITGSTGGLGTGIINQLIEKGYSSSSITAFVRNEEKTLSMKEQGIVVKLGNYYDYQSMLEAFSGAEKLLLISGNEMDSRIE